MDFYLNELSLHNQFTSFETFSESLENILSIRSLLKKHNKVLFCYTILLDFNVYANANLRQVINNFDRDKKLLILSWLTKDGPFWEENRHHLPDEYYEYIDDVVTDKSLAEVAFNISNNHQSSTISFSPSNFEFTPLIVKWCRSDNPIHYLNIINYWQKNEVENYLQNSDSEIDSWASLITKIKRDFPTLILLDSFSEGLQGEPFNFSIAKQAYNLISILEDIKSSLNNDDSPSAKTNEMIENYFKRGKNSLFTDCSESELNNPVLRNKVTFGGRIYSMHGKIRHRFFRLHFSWPILKSQPTTLAYLGQKLTK
jgi:hypothetical protein